MTEPENAISPEARALAEELADFITAETALVIMTEHLTKAKADALDEAAREWLPEDFRIPVSTPFISHEVQNWLRARAAEVRGG